MSRLAQLLRTTQLQITKRDFEGAMRTSNQALVLDQNCARVYANMGVIYLATYQPNLAIETYHKALAIAPNNISMKNYLARAYTSQEQFEEAFTIQSQVLHEHPNNLTARRGLGYSLTGLNLYSEAKNNFGIVIDHGVVSSSKRGRRKERHNIVMSYIGLMQLHTKTGEVVRVPELESELRRFKLKTTFGNIVNSIKGK